jgi:uncharacterized protein YabE (DUF348 family)
MNEFITKYQKWLVPVMVLALLGGIILVWLGLTQTITIVYNGQSIQVRSAAISTKGVLRSAGIKIDAEDRIAPAKEGFFWNRGLIQIDKAETVIIRTPAEEMTVKTVEPIPGNLLQQVGINLFPHDRLMLNGVEIDPSQPLKDTDNHLIQYQPAIPLQIVIGDAEQIIYTNQPTLGAALEAASISFSPVDWISEPLLTPVTEMMQVEIRRARPVTVRTSDAMVTGLTSAATVGEALLELGIPLQNLDYSVPGEDTPIPGDGEISIVRVRETLTIATEEIPFESDYQEDPETPLDQISVIQPGQPAIFASRQRIISVEGEEIWRSPDENWQASETKKGIMGMGSKILIQTAVVDGQTIEYWRKISVYATSYKPCDANGVCHDGTAGGYPLQQGIIAVSPHWYSVPNGLGMADLSVYVPGYGYAIIGDVCGGCSGEYWIDLAYREENYIPWYHWTTMYFLTPVPQRYIPLIITP